MFAHGARGRDVQTHETGTESFARLVGRPVSPIVGRGGHADYQMVTGCGCACSRSL